MSVNELQKVLGVSRCTAYELTKRKDFPSFRIGKKVLINREGLDRWMKEQVSKKDDD